MTGIINVTQRGSFRNTEKFLTTVPHYKIEEIMNKYGKEGVLALSQATPIDSSRTANSWSYQIVLRRGYASLRFFNSNRQNGSNVAILIQYGHATRNGGFVWGRDYVNPAIQPIFERLSKEIWREVTR